MSSNTPAPAPVSLPLRCFSQIANVRCQGLSDTQQIATLIPVLGLAFLLPFVVLSTWRLPRASLLLLGIEMVLQLGVNGWNLGYFLDRPGLGTYRSTDTALAVAAATPILAYLLALTSHLLSDLRTHLPYSLQSKVSTVVFAVLVAPLIPLAYAGGLMGGFAFVEHRRLRGVVFLDFTDGWEEWVNVILTDVGTIAALAYILFIALMAVNILLHPPSTTSFLTVSPTLTPLVLCTAGVVLSAAELALGLLPLSPLSLSAGFAVILLRKVLLLVSRTGVVLGLILVYKQVEERRKRVSSIFVRGPMRGTFRKLDTAGTREFYNAQSQGREQVVEPGFDVATVDPATGQTDGLLMRPARPGAPKLSFTSSVFGFAPGLNFAVSANSSPTGSSGRPRRLHDQSQAQNQADGVRRQTAKKNLGSIYAPKRITVDLLDLAQWPPPSRHQAHLGGQGAENGLVPSSTRGSDAATAGTSAGRSEHGRDPFANPSPATFGNGDRARQVGSSLHLPSSGGTGTSTPSPDGSPVGTGPRGERISPFRSRGTPPYLTFPPVSASASRSNSIRRKLAPTPTPTPTPDDTSPTVGAALYRHSSFTSSCRRERRETDPAVAMDPALRPHARPSSLATTTSDSPSTLNRRATLFFSTPAPSPTVTSPDKADFRFTSTSSLHRTLAPTSASTSRAMRESETLPFPTSSPLPSSAAFSFGRYSSESAASRPASRSGGPDAHRQPALLASLARLRRETGMPIDQTRLSGLSSMSGYGYPASPNTLSRGSLRPDPDPDPGTGTATPTSTMTLGPGPTPTPTPSATTTTTTTPGLSKYARSVHLMVEDDGAYSDRSAYGYEHGESGGKSGPEKLGKQSGADPPGVQVAVNGGGARGWWAR